MLKAIVRDTDAELLSPSHALDQARLALLMFLKPYVRLCGRLLGADGALIAVNTIRSARVTSGTLRYRNTLRVYHRVFGADAPSDFDLLLSL